MNVLWYICNWINPHAVKCAITPCACTVTRDITIVIIIICNAPGKIVVKIERADWSRGTVRPPSSLRIRTVYLKTGCVLYEKNIYVGIRIKVKKGWLWKQFNGEFENGIE